MTEDLKPKFNFDPNLNTALSELPQGENAQTSKEEDTAENPR